MSKLNNTKVITGKNTRLSYFNGWEPKSINGGPEKYSVSLLIPKKVMLKRLRLLRKLLMLRLRKVSASSAVKNQTSKR